MYSGNGEKRRKIKQKIVTGGMAILIGMACICGICSAFSQTSGKEEESTLRRGTADFLKGQLLKTYMPVFAFMEDETGSADPERLLARALLSQLPVYAYSETKKSAQVSVEDEDTLDLLIREEGTDEERKEIEDGSLEYEEDALHIDGDLKQAMEKENGLHNGESKGEGNGDNAAGDGKKGGKGNGTEAEDGNGETQGEKTGEGRELMPPEGGETGKEFEKATEKSYSYDWKELTGYEELVSAFYAIDRTTSVTDEQLNLKNLLGRDVSMQGDSDAPQILIYHTHSQEAFADSVPGDASTTIVGAGEKLAGLLRDKYGYNVLHHTGEYDVEARDYAYSNALPAIEQILLENPGIEVVIDLHRDAVAEGRKLSVNLKGRPTAQFMFFNGLSRTRQKGDISYLENPYVNDNLAFSFQAQVACNEYYPGVARRIYLKAYRYNMHLRAKSMLVELGAQTNTVEEIMNACDPLAHVIAKVLSGETGDEARDGAGIEMEE